MDNESDINFPSISSHNNNNSSTLSKIKKKVKNSNGHGTLDRIDLNRNRLGILDSLSLNSVPVIVNTNSKKIKRRNREFEAEDKSQKDSFG
jgi:hypothetical protein